MENELSRLPVDTILHCLDYYDCMKYPEHNIEKPYLQWFGKLNGQVIQLYNRFYFSNRDKKWNFLNSTKLPLFCEISLSYEDLAKVKWELTRNHCLVIRLPSLTNFDTKNDLIQKLQEKWSHNIGDIRFLGSNELLKCPFIQGKHITIYSYGIDFEILSDFIQNKIGTTKLNIILCVGLIIGGVDILKLVVPYLTELYLNCVYSMDSAVYVIQNSKLNKLSLRFGLVNEGTESIESFYELLNNIVGSIRLNELILGLSDGSPVQKPIVIALEKFLTKIVVLNCVKILSETLIETINHHKTLKKVIFTGGKPINWTRLDKLVEFK